MGIVNIYICGYEVKSACYMRPQMISYKNHRKTCIQFHGNACAKKVSCPLMPFKRHTSSRNGSTLVRQEKGNDCNVWQCMFKHVTCKNKWTKTVSFNHSLRTYSTTDFNEQSKNIKISNAKTIKWTWRHGHGSNHIYTAMYFKGQPHVSFNHHDATSRPYKPNPSPYPPKGSLLNTPNKKDTPWREAFLKLE